MLLLPRRFAAPSPRTELAGSCCCQSDLKDKNPTKFRHQQQSDNMLYVYRLLVFCRLSLKYVCKHNHAYSTQGD